jgi:hypothetical protein
MLNMQTAQASKDATMAYSVKILIKVICYFILKDLIIPTISKE